MPLLGYSRVNSVPIRRLRTHCTNPLQLMTNAMNSAQHAQVKSVDVFVDVVPLDDQCVSLAVRVHHTSTANDNNQTHAKTGLGVCRTQAEHAWWSLPRRGRLWSRAQVGIRCAVQACASIRSRAGHSTTLSGHNTIKKSALSDPCG